MARLSAPASVCAAVLALAAGIFTTALTLAPGAATAAAPMSSLQTELARSTAALTQAAGLIAATDESRPTISAASPITARRRAAALRALARNRLAFGRAKAQAARILRTAGTSSDRVLAAQALGLVAEVQNRSIPNVLDLLVPAAGATERGLATAELDLTIGRDQALGLNVALMGAGLSVEVTMDLVDQVTRLATGRLDEVTKLLNALTSGAVSLAAKSTLARALDANLAGQALAALRIDGLIDLGQLSTTAEQALSGALSLIPTELQRAADILDDGLALIPPGLRGFVGPIIQNALASVQTILGQLLPGAPAPTTPTVTTPAPTTPTVPTPTAPAVPTLGDLLGSLPLPVDPRNLLNLLPGLASPCNLAGFLPSLIPINPLGLLSGLSGLLGGLGGCPGATAPAG
jgi:hypothetical protein